MKNIVLFLSLFLSPLSFFAEDKRDLGCFRYIHDVIETVPQKSGIQRCNFGYIFLADDLRCACGKPAYVFLFYDNVSVFICENHLYDFKSNLIFNPYVDPRSVCLGDCYSTNTDERVCKNICLQDIFD